MRVRTEPTQLRSKSNLASPPSRSNATISFVVNGTSFPIDPEKLSLGKIGNGTFCVGAILDGGADNRWVIGTTFRMSLLKAKDVMMLT